MLLEETKIQTNNVAVNYRQCTHCILDTQDAPDITFNEKGVCNYCTNYEKNYILNKPTAQQKKDRLNQYIREIKEHGKGKKYDCILGVSGGVDSSYLALLCKEFGLNPLLVHFDNGWNSELAVENIERITQYTGFDLHTYVVDWEEFRSLQLAYVRSGVLDWEIPTDHGFIAYLYNLSLKNGIKHILTGHNYQTEAILPKAMRWSKFDVANILDINKQYGTQKLKSFPLLPFWKNFYIQKVKEIEPINILHYVDYNKESVKKIIMEKMGWRDYGGKHYESIFTKFYQGYVLREKFGFDKRKAHLSNLICSGQITRDEALAEIKKPSCDVSELKADTEYFTKKLEISMEEFDEIMKAPPRSHLDFKSYETGVYVQHEKFMAFIKPITKLIKKLLGR